jgi:LPS export ABC transporter protein LptC
MSGLGLRALAGACVLAAGFTACGGSATQTAASPSPAASETASAAASATPSPAASGSLATNPPGNTLIKFSAPRTGDKFIYLTKQSRNRKVYVLRADAENGVYFGTNTGRSSFVNPHITFYGNNGKRVVANAPAGLVVESEKSVEMSGGVHARSQDGVTLTSDDMLYNDANDTIHAVGNVVMNSPTGSELRGTTLDWNLTTGAVNVSGAR